MKNRPLKREGASSDVGGLLPEAWAVGDTEEGRFLRRMALVGPGATRERQILVNRFAAPADAESEVVFESCLHRVRCLAQARAGALRTLSDLFGRESRVECTVTEAGWLVALEYLFGQKGIAECADELARAHSPFPEAPACRAFLVVCRLGLTFALPGTTGRDCLLGWLVLDGWEQRQTLEALFRQYAHTALAKSVEDSMDPVAWSTEIFSLADRLHREDPLVPAWGWLDAEFRLASLMAPVDEWVVAAIAHEQGLPDAALPALRRAYAAREAIADSPALRTELHMDIAAAAPRIAPERIHAIARRLLSFSVPRERLFDPGRIGR